MVDSSADFEAFYQQEREKANRVLPPGSTFGLNKAPSRYLFFARDEEERLGSAVSKDSELSTDKKSTLNGYSLGQGNPMAFHSNSNQMDVIDTFRKGPENHESTAQRFL